MKTSKILLTAAVFAVIAICSIGAQAQAPLTWVSGVGDDVNPCSRTAPCKTWAGAISKTAAGGMITALDSGTFGALTITKAITIDGGGVHAITSAQGVTGFTINAGVADTVTIRNLSIVGVETGTTGINFAAAGQVNIENCAIRGLSTNGINVAATAVGVLLVKDTVIFDTNRGINIAAGASGVTASLDNVRLQGSAIGLNVTANAVVTISDSVISNNTDAGIAADGTVQVNAENVVINNNGTGVRANGTSTVRMSNLNIFNNTTGLSRTASGVIASFSNNKIMGNSTQGSPSTYLANQ